jgi:hypothetical protein
MSNVQSYNALIDRFHAFASGHFILKRFSHGQIEVSDLEKFGEYPFMHVVPSNVTYAKGMKTFSFQIVLADMPRDKEDKTEYQREVLSDLQRIAEDLVAEITNHRVLFGDLITVNNVSLEPFLEEFQHTLTGWTISLDLLVPYYWDACSIPAEWNDFFESSTGGTGSILTFIDSITRDENGNVSLVNDEAEPSPNYYYGTNDEGVRGWYLLSDEVGLTCVTLPTCQTIIDIEAAIDLLQQDVIDLNADVALKANTADISAVGFSNDYNDLDNKPTIPPAITNTSELVNDGEDGVNPFITAQDLPDTSGFVPYTGATTNVDLGTHTLSAKDLVINHSSGSGVAASITKGGAGEALTVNKTSGSGNAMSVTGGVTQLSELHLTTDLADAYIASAATWNAKFNLPALTSGSVLFSNGTTIAQDNANLFWDDTNKRFRIGAATTTSKFSVTDDVLAEIQSAVYSNTAGNAGAFLVRKSRGSIASPSALLSGDRLGGFFFSGNNTGSGFHNPCALIAFAAENFTGSAAGGYFAFETTANGTISRTEKMRLLGNGNVLINTTTDAGFRLDVNGTARVQGEANVSFLSLGGNTAVNNSGTTMILGASGGWAGVRVPRYFETTGSISAAAGVARGTFLNQTLVATANNNVLVGLDIAPTFTTGAFTGTISAALRVNGNIIPLNGGVGNLGTPQLPFNNGLFLGTVFSNFIQAYNSHLNFNTTGFVTVGRFFSGTGNFTLQNGGTFTDAGYRLDVNGSVRTTGSISAAAGVGRGTLLNQTLVATANNDTLYGLDIVPTFTNGAFTGVANFHIRLSSNGMISGNNQINLLRGRTFLFFGGELETNVSTNGSTVPLKFSLNGTANIMAQFFGTTGNFTLQNGGTFTDIASARLAVNSTTQGFLPPRMTNAQKLAIASPVAGLVVYDTTLNKLCVRTASSWETITSI